MHNNNTNSKKQQIPPATKPQSRLGSMPCSSPVAFESIVIVSPNEFSALPSGKFESVVVPLMASHPAT